MAGDLKDDVVRDPVELATAQLLASDEDLAVVRVTPLGHLSWPARDEGSDLKAVPAGKRGNAR